MATRRTLGLREKRSASALLDDKNHSQLLSTGCPTLNAVLGGGIDRIGITEIAGEAGAGKTQLTLQLMLQVQLPYHLGGLQGGAVYLYGDTASAEPALRRLDQLAAAFAVRFAVQGADRERLKQNVYVLQIDDPDDLWRTINERMPALLETAPVRLLVLDSVGGVFRSAADDAISGGGGGASARSAHGQRAQQLLRLAARLKQLADTYSIATVVVNQVTDKPSDEQHRRLAAPWEVGACGTPDGGSARVPALGPAWSSCVNTRIVLTRREVATPVVGGPGGAYEATWQRHMHVAWSPRVPAAEAPFWVKEHGVVGKAVA